MDPPNILSYVGLDSSSMRPDQCATSSHERQQQRGTRLGTHGHPTPAFARTPSPQSDLQTLAAASSPFNTSDALDASRPSPQRVKRPRNAFMIFRSEFNSMHDKISRNVEHDNRHISRIVGHYWNQMSEHEKDVWKKRANEEKLEHMRKYPDYKFAPIPRTKKLKRNMKRNGDDEMERCRLVADLLLEGKRGDELLSALKASDPRDNGPTKEETPLVKVSPSEGGRPHEQVDPFVLTTTKFPVFKHPLVFPNVEAQATDSFFSFKMGAGVYVDQGLYNTQQIYQQPQELREYHCDHSAVTPMPTKRSATSRSNCAQYVDMRTDINSHMHMQSPCSPEGQYLVTSPADFEESYQTSQMQGEATHSRYGGEHLSPPHVAYYSEVHYNTKRRFPSPAVTFRNPFADHQNHRAHVHLSPPLSPTDMRGFWGDPAVPRHRQDGRY